MWAGTLAAASLALAALLLPDAAREAREAATDLLMGAVPRSEAASPVLAVAVTDTDLAAVGPWPWPRARIADLLRRLTEAGSAAIALDVAFSEPAPGDAALEAALTAAPAVTALLAGTAAPHSRFAVGRIGDPDVSGLPLLPGIEASPLTGGDGALAVLPGRTVRAVPLIARIGAGPEAQLLPGLALAAIARAVRVETMLLRAGSPPQLQLGPYALPFPTDGALRLDLARFPVPVLSAGELLRGEGAEAARGRIVLVGVTSPQAAPLRPSVLGPFTPSLPLQAEAVAQLAAGWVPLRPTAGACWKRGSRSCSGSLPQQPCAAGRSAALRPPSP